MLLTSDIGFAAPLEFEVGGAPEQLTAADVNGDGRLDLVMANSRSDTVSIMLSNGDGTFQPTFDFPTGSFPVAIAVADINGDGRADLLTANFSQTVSVLLQDAGAQFSFRQPISSPAGAFASAVIAADVVGDQNLDLVVPYVGNPSEPGGISILEGNGTGVFLPLEEIGTDLRPVDVAVRDFNGDQQLDIAAANGFIFAGPENNDVVVLLSAGNGSFHDPVRYLAGDRPSEIEAADVSGDQIPDLVVVNEGSNDISVLFGATDGTFSAPTSYDVGEGADSLVLTDLNADGYLDVAAANGTSSDISTLVNLGDGTFVPQGRFAINTGPASIAAGDFNEDKLQDLTVVSQDPGRTFVHLNKPVEREDFVALDGSNIVYQQDFDTALGHTGSYLPVGWSAIVDGLEVNSVTRSYSARRPSNGTFNAGLADSPDRALSLGNAADVINELQFHGQVTRGNVTDVRLEFDIEAWQADVDLAAIPGKAAFNVVLEADSGSGYQTVIDFGKTTTGPTLNPPRQPLGEELWKTNGVDVSLVADIVPGPDGSRPNRLTTVDDVLYFNAGGSVFSFDGLELSRISEAENSIQGVVKLSDTTYIYDGLWRHRANVFLEVNKEGDVVANVPNSFGLSGSFSHHAVFKDEIYFSASQDLGVGKELWKLDRNTNRIVLVADINPRFGGISLEDNSSNPQDLTVVNDSLYFTAGAMTTRDVRDRDLWRFDGESVERLTDGNASVAELTAIDDVIYFHANIDSDGEELWKVEEGIVTKIADINPGPNSALPRDYQASFTEFKDEVYFVAQHSETGAELWKTDGTKVIRVTDINPGPDDSVSRGHIGWSSTGSADPIIVFNDELYFSAKGSTGGFRLWKTDGEVVSEVGNLNPSGYFLRDEFFTNFLIHDDALYFTAIDDSTGYELWKTDGMTVERVTDINPGPGDSLGCSGCRHHFAVYQDEVYFPATNGDGSTAPLLNGNAPENRVSFDSGLISAEIPAGATLRLRFVAQDPDANVGYVVGLDNVKLQLIGNVVGDTNADGIVNFADFVVVSQNFGQQVGGGSTDGDFDDDGRVTFADFILLSNNFDSAVDALATSATPSSSVTRSSAERLTTVDQDASNELELREQIFQNFDDLLSVDLDS